MLTVLRNTWALLGGLMLLMIGNGMQGTLLGIRGTMEGFDPFVLSFVMAAYFIGFLFSARLTPRLIARVGHVRVFAALGSVISACFILYATIVDPVAWFFMRIAVGFCYCGVYIVVESWLNDNSDNKMRGQAMSAYILVQLIGVIAAQFLINLASIRDYTLFVTISVLVSLSFLPILLSASPAPVFQSTRPMSLGRLYRTSPLGFVSAFLVGAVFSSIFGMASVYGTAQGLTVRQISIFIGVIYFASLVVQYPLGWLSDRMDRRRLVFLVCVVSSLGAFVGMASGDSFALILAAGALVGGLASPLWSIVIAHTNDFLDPPDMAAASGGLLFANGLGAIGGAPILGLLMSAVAPWMFFAFNGAVMGAIALYALYRMTQRPSPAVADTTRFATVMPQATPVITEAVVGRPGEKAA